MKNIILGGLLVGAVAVLSAADVRDGLPSRSSSYYKVILMAIKDGDLAKAQSAMEKLKPLAEHLDKRFGDQLSAGGAGGQKAARLLLLNQAMIYQSISLSYDEALENFSGEDEIRKKVRYAMEEFAEIEPYMKEKGEEGFKGSRDIRKFIQQSLTQTSDKDKFQKSALEIKKSYARVFPDAVVYTLKASLTASQKEAKYRQVAQTTYQAVNEVLRAKDASKGDVVEKAVNGSEGDVSAAVGALEQMFPGIKE